MVEETCLLALVRISDPLSSVNILSWPRDRLVDDLRPAIEPRRSSERQYWR